MFNQRKATAFLRGVVFAASVLVAPGALAHDCGYDHIGSRSHHAHRIFAAAYRNEGSWREASYGGRHYSRARVLRAEYMSRASYAALEARRDRRESADARERPITAELNLVQLRGGREHAAEIAQWQLRYGAAASAKG